MVQVKSLDGWYSKSGVETRYESEERSMKFYLWFCDYLDSRLKQEQHDETSDEDKDEE